VARCKIFNVEEGGDRGDKTTSFAEASFILGDVRVPQESEGGSDILYDV
jgi:hypothetical protein